jgi:predicted DNA-binding transcriptional regulator YafY
MEAGVPIGSEAGKGYFIVDGFHLPPVMFTQDEANSMISGRQVGGDRLQISRCAKRLAAALYKIKSVLSDDDKDGVENLDSNIQVYFRGRTNENQDHSPFPIIL